VSTAQQTALDGKVGTGDSRLSDARTPTDGSVTAAKFATNVLDTDSTMAADSDTRVPSQKAVKAFVAAAVAANDAMRFMGGIDASGNPGYPEGNVGETWRITVPGKIGGGSGPNVELNDTLIAVADNAGGTHGSVGSSWLILQANVDGAVIGPVSAVTDERIAVFDGTSGRLVKQASVGVAGLAAAAHTHPASDVSSWTGLPVWFTVAISDETTAITTGTAKVTFRMPHAMTLTAVRASLTTASSSGTPTFDINEGGSSILSTKLTVDASELTSTTAATAAVISDSSLADDAEITIDVDTAGTGAKGAKITFIGTRA